jgi:hypothetical protein
MKPTKKQKWRDERGALRKNNCRRGLGVRNGPNNVCIYE